MRDDFLGRLERQEDRMMGWFHKRGGEGAALFMVLWLAVFMALTLACTLLVSVFGGLLQWLI